MPDTKGPYVVHTLRAGARRNYWGGEAKNFSSRIGAQMHWFWHIVLFYRKIIVKWHRRCRF